MLLMLKKDVRKKLKLMDYKAHTIVLRSNILFIWVNEFTLSLFLGAVTYRCLHSDIILKLDYICDKIVHCPLGDDERFCNFR